MKVSEVLSDRNAIMLRSKKKNQRYNFKEK